MHEYSNAIFEFEDLVRISSPEQLQVLNEVIAEQPEYAFFSVSYLDEQGEANPDSANYRKKGPAGKRHSLQWMLALARIEVGAGVAMYGHVESAFELMRPGPFAAEEYFKLVAADAEAHWKALNTDQAFVSKVKKPKSVNSDTIAYMRRLKVVNDMVEYTRNNNDRDEVGFAAGDMLLGLRKAMKELASQASSAIVDISHQSHEIGTNSKSRNRNTTDYGNDIVSRSPITRSCQRLFLKRTAATGFDAANGSGSR